MELLRRVGFFCALWTLQCCASVLGAISRDAIFLRYYAASSVAALTLTLSLSTAYALTLATQLVDKLAARAVRPGILYAISPLVLGCGLLVLTLLSLVAPVLARATSVLLYLWLEVQTQWLTQQFWDLCAKGFDVAQSKKFFGMITFGSTFGSLSASFVVLPVVQSRQLPTEFNLLVSSGMLFFIAGVLFVSAEHFTSANIAPSGKKTKNQKPGDPRTDTSSSTVIIRDIQARTYLKHICFFDMLATVMRVLVDNTTLSVVSLQPEEEVKASLSMINGLQSFLMIPMQLLSGPFFTHFGVMYGIAMLPVTIFLFGASTYISTSAYSLIFTRALYNAVSQAIFNPARQLLWLPFNESERGRFQNFVCGPFRSLSRIFGAVLSMFLTASLVVQFIGASSSSIIMIATSVAWFVDALAARKSYASEFYASLRQGYLDLTSPLVDFTPDQIVLVKETLVNGEQTQANFVLSSLSHEHIGLFSQELRALFYKTSRDAVPLTPMHTKLRLLNLHTAAKRDFVLHAQESYLLPDASTFPTGIFNTMDLMMLVKDKSVAVPRQLRVAAILACGYEKFNMYADQCSEMLHKLLRGEEEDKSVVVCAAVALLRLSDWMDEEANVILQRLLHEEKVLEARVVGLKIVGKELPELLGDGFLVYLLHHSSTQIVQAAVECCSNSSRNSRMLIPALMKHLANSLIRSQIVTALKGFEPAALWGPLCQYTEEILRLPTQALSNYALTSDRIHNKREGLAGALKVLDLGGFPLEDKLDFLLHLMETLLVTSKAPDDGVDKVSTDVLHHLFGKDVVMEELIVDALLSLIASTDEKTMNSFSQLMDPIHHALSIKIREAHEMRHVLELFFQICPRTATNIEETSPLLLQHVEHSLKETLRLLLKLLSTGFPKEFDVAVILEGLQSDLGQVHSAIQEVLENLLPSSYKGLVLPLLFPKLSTTKAASKMAKDVEELFGGKDGVDNLLDVMKHQDTELELSALALHYFLHIAGNHAEHLTDAAKLNFQDEIIPNLLSHELTKELLIETYHGSPEVLPYESVANLKDCEPPLLSRIAVANCLRVSSLFENVCAISILRVISHHFLPITVTRGQTFAVEGDIASAMYVVATGTVQLHKERRILAVLGFGTCVGQAALLQHSLHAGTHISSATALEDCILLSISREELDALIKETPQVSRGVLNAVASSLQLLYFEPLRAIAQSGSLPRRDRRASLTAETAHSDSEKTHPMLKITESLTTNIKAALSVDRAAKSFLYNVGRCRTTPRGGPLSLPGRRRSLSNSQPTGRSPTLASKGLLALSDPADYTTFEKSIHLKASHLMRNLDDDKVSLVAQLSRVVMLSHGDVLYSSGTTVECIYVIIDGTMEITHPQGDSDASTASTSIKLHGGDCFGEEVRYLENPCSSDSHSTW
ncbi:ATP-binding Cassette (ABC) superfamily [Phytophthora infestans T30-4]|uniref:ATP-binding Cassette (ABC) superfamily n=1 Tax=Phytophthora infestans (strain T30-4) TaxID=403677 RepID=D0NEC5_PHYIT|nr:ATP-binding Cassette (ABC) superfamily [Phytophthora infestans T30-4]EEY56570.1 ATP-binding Cassette (ABC) superfamily [Phytophthora infestans T30-4]|eukprot:XP_002902644.1 ATP-binding Cassette (ABC) superfamily [Phytophthora infestans T30-4]